MSSPYFPHWPVPSSKRCSKISKDQRVLSRMSLAQNVVRIPRTPIRRTRASSITNPSSIESLSPRLYNNPNADEESPCPLNPQTKPETSINTPHSQTAGLGYGEVGEFFPVADSTTPQRQEDQKITVKGDLGEDRYILGFSPVPFSLDAGYLDEQNPSIPILVKSRMEDHIAPHRPRSSFLDFSVPSAASYSPPSLCGDAVEYAPPTPPPSCYPFGHPEGFGSIKDNFGRFKSKIPRSAGGTKKWGPRATSPSIIVYRDMNNNPAIISVADSHIHPGSAHMHPETLVTVSHSIPLWTGPRLSRYDGVLLSDSPDIETWVDLPAPTFDSPHSCMCCGLNHDISSMSSKHITERATLYSQMEVLRREIQILIDSVNTATSSTPVLLLSMRTFVDTAVSIVLEMQNIVSQFREHWEHNIPSFSRSHQLREYVTKETCDTSLKALYAVYMEGFSHLLPVDKNCRTMWDTCAEGFLLFQEVIEDADAQVAGEFAKFILNCFSEVKMLMEKAVDYHSSIATFAPLVTFSSAAGVAGRGSALERGGWQEEGREEALERRRVQEPRRYEALMKKRSQETRREKTAAARVRIEQAREEAARMIGVIR